MKFIIKDDKPKVLKEVKVELSLRETLDQVEVWASHEGGRERRIVVFRSNGKLYRWADAGSVINGVPLNSHGRIQEDSDSAGL